jgi:hypothetical protein
MKECPVDRAATPFPIRATVNGVNIAEPGGIPVTAFQNDVMARRCVAPAVAAELPY